VQDCRELRSIQIPKRAIRDLKKGPTLLRDLQANVKESCDILESTDDIRKSIRQFKPASLLPELSCEPKLANFPHSNSNAQLPRGFRNSVMEDP
jgi:hypothetical protein